MSAAWITAAFASFVLLLFLAGRRALLRVPEGQVLAVRRFGRSERVLTPGLRVLLPLADRVVRRVSLTGHSMRLERRLLACGDLRAIAVEGVVFFQFLDPLEAARAAPGRTSAFLRSSPARSPSWRDPRPRRRFASSLRSPFPARSSSASTGFSARRAS